MKKWIVLTMMVFSCIVSCDDKAMTTDRPDNSLTGLVRLIIGYKNIEEEGMYNGSSVESSNTTLSVWKISDTKIQLRYYSKWDEVPLYIDIPSIPVSGERNNVVLNSSFDSVELKYDNESYLVSGSISGWIKLAMDSKASQSLEDPATPDFICDININLSVDGKTFNLKITSIKP